MHKVLDLVLSATNRFDARANYSVSVPVLGRVRGRRRCGVATQLNARLIAVKARIRFQINRFVCSLFSIFIYSKPRCQQQCAL